MLARRDELPFKAQTEGEQAHLSLQVQFHALSIRIICLAAETHTHGGQRGHHHNLFDLH